MTPTTPHPDISTPSRVGHTATVAPARPSLRIPQPTPGLLPPPTAVQSPALDKCAVMRSTLGVSHAALSRSAPPQAPPPPQQAPLLPPSRSTFPSWSWGPAASSLFCPLHHEPALLSEVLIPPTHRGEGPQLPTTLQAVLAAAQLPTTSWGSSSGAISLALVSDTAWVCLWVIRQSAC